MECWVGDERVKRRHGFEGWVTVHELRGWRLGGWDGDAVLCARCFTDFVRFIHALELLC